MEARKEKLSSAHSMQSVEDELREKQRKLDAEAAAKKDK